ILPIDTICLSRYVMVIITLIFLAFQILGRAP
ncbi:MAG: hypothetical protein ACI8RD_005459, partial [Bacillariaceae sp.]